MLSLKQNLAKNYINALGWRTNRKLLLIESDDWGSIRMPNKKTFNNLLSKNIEVDKFYFDKYDSLESHDDLVNLFEVLASVKDINNNNAVITAYSVVANPNFEEISKSNKARYIYEPITETYKRYENCNNTFSLIVEGASKRLLYPQFHGREHLHTLRWIEAINSKSIKEQLAFDLHAFISAKKLDDLFDYPYGYMAAFNWLNPSESTLLCEIIYDGLDLFERLFGFKSISFVASQAIWGNEINRSLNEKGVVLQVGKQYYPIGNNHFKMVNKKWGSKNQIGQIHWRRNCSFEPSSNQSYDWVSGALQEIAIAFRWGKPAVINSHRVNYIGSIFPENRDQSLKKLKILLKEVQKRWPDVEFIDTERLAHIMMETNQ